MNKVDTGHLLHGGDYNPEQWLDHPEILKIDIERFLEAKINTVTLGVFSWAKLEPQEGVFDFGWLEEIIDRLYVNGISVILSTPSGGRPRWLAEKYPEVLRVTDRRERNLFNRRQNHCFTSPAYREKVRLIDTELVKRLGGHPAVKMWHISNELGGECHCPLCQRAFQGWLKEKYQTIENLNERWYTTFWSHTYSDFAQVESPSAMREGVEPLGETSDMSLALDWKRFVSHQTIDFMEQEIRAIREAGSDKPVTANLMYNFQGIDYFRLAEKLDVVSWDNYPTWSKKADCIIAADTGFWHDVMRSLKRKPFLLMESCPGATNWQSLSKLKKPGMVEAAALQAIAHGGDGALYFQMRQGRGAEEKFHGAVIDHYGGRDSRTFQDVCRAGKMLERISAVTGADTPCEAAVLYDWENRWAVEGSYGPRNKGMHHLDCVQNSYYALRRLGLNVDLADQASSLEDYKFVAAPMQYLFHPGFAERLRSYVKQGGMLVMTYWSGVVDENDLCFLGKAPYELTDMLGLRREEIDALYDWEENTICRHAGGLSGMKDSYVCKNLCELVKPEGAETLMVYGSDFYAGRPALLRNAYGEGTVYYICADAEQGFYDDLYRILAQTAGLQGTLPGEIPVGVEASCREDDAYRYVFVQNFSDQMQHIELPEGEVLYGSGEKVLMPLEGTVIKVAKTI